MSLVTLLNVTKSFGAQLVLSDLSFQVEEGDRIGLIGVNGSGKTTLLRLISGLELPDSGSVVRARDLRIGYLPQEPALEEGQTVLQAAMEAFADLREMEEALGAIERQMSSARGAEMGQLIRKHDRLQNQYELRGGYEQHRRAEAVLMGLGFARDDLQAKVQVLSGGERTRLMLARLLLRKPDLLLLDEPTNHLDIRGIKWLEQFLTREQGGVVIVSHDRRFLDRTVTRILELERSRATMYRGNYSDHVRQKEERRLAQERAYRSQQAMIAHDEEFIRRYHAGQRAGEARSRRRKLDRLQPVERPHDPKRTRICFRAAERSGELVARLHMVTKAFGENVLFRELSLDLARGDRLGIVGPNGSGKSTLLRLLLGIEQPSDGQCTLGKGLRIGYLDQLLTDLDGSRTALEEVWQIAPSLKEQDIRDILARFLLRGDHVFKKVADMSGGERTRVALAKLMLISPNVLLLDEPTNHLDISGREALEEALEEYDGTLVVVSHDRHFLDRVVRKLLVIGDGRARLYLGNYSFYEAQLAVEAEDRLARATPQPRPPSPVSAPPRRRPLDEIESEIETLEVELAHITAAMGRESTYTDPVRVRALMQRYEEIRHLLTRLNAEWEEQIN